MVKLAELRTASCNVVVEFDQTAIGIPVLKNASLKYVNEVVLPADTISVFQSVPFQ